MASWHFDVARCGCRLCLSLGVATVSSSFGEFLLKAFSFLLNIFY